MPRRAYNADVVRARNRLGLPGHEFRGVGRGLQAAPVVASAGIAASGAGHPHPRCGVGDAECRCQHPPFEPGDFETRFVGLDDAGGRFAEVTLQRCWRCGRQWLHYRIEQEGFSHSGRWYRGTISGDAAARATAADAARLLATLPWHFYGGSYYRSSGARSDGPVDTTRL